MNGMGYGAPLPGLTVDSATDTVAVLHWASCLLQLCFSICGMQRCNLPHRIVGELSELNSFLYEWHMVSTYQYSGSSSSSSKCLILLWFPFCDDVKTFLLCRREIKTVSSGYAAVFQRPNSQRQWLRINQLNSS